MKQMKISFGFILITILISGCCRVLGINCPLPPPPLAEQQAYQLISESKQHAQSAITYAKLKFKIYDDKGKLTEKGNKLYKLYDEAYKKGNTYIDCLINHQNEVLEDSATKYHKAVKDLTDYVKQPKYGEAPVVAAGDIIKGLVDGGNEIWKAAKVEDEKQKKAYIQNQKKRLEELRLEPWGKISK